MNKKKKKEAEGFVSKNQGRIDELETDIKQIKSSIKDPDIPEETIAGLKESLLEAESELKRLVDEDEAAREKERKRIELEAKPKITVGGKAFEEISPEEAEETFRTRMERADKLAGVAKTKSVVEKSTVLQEEADAE